VPPGTVVAAVIRNGRPVVPGAQVRLCVGDELLLVSETANADDIHAAFQ
jgi:trk system potassium uptake protein TrkA